MTTIERGQNIANVFVGSGDHLRSRPIIGRVADVSELLQTPASLDSSADLHPRGGRPGARVTPQRLAMPGQRKARRSIDQRSVLRSAGANPSSLRLAVARYYPTPPASVLRSRPPFSPMTPSA
jgi:hypothetical protein